MNRELPVLMTASVSTRGMKGADFSDEVENSGWNLSAFKMKFQDEKINVAESEKVSA